MHEFVQKQLDDVRNSRRELTRVIKSVDEEIVRVFETAFADVAMASASAGVYQRVSEARIAPCCRASARENSDFPIPGPDTTVSSSGRQIVVADMPVGTIVHNVELKKGGGGQLARSAGNYAQLVGKDAGYAQIKLSSGELRLAFDDAHMSVKDHGRLGGMLRREQEEASRSQAILEAVADGVLGLCR